MDINLPVIYDVENMEVFRDMIRTNPGVIIFKFGADWCGPCRKAKPIIMQHLGTLGPRIQYVEINVDESIELYSFLKNKRQIIGIPCMLAYHKGNNTYLPNDMVSGADAEQITKFFERCKKIVH